MEIAGIMSKPEDYSFHWYAEYKDNTSLRMFDESGVLAGKRPFVEVISRSGMLNFILWVSTTNPEHHFGINLEGPLPLFMVGGRLLQPQDKDYFAGFFFEPNFFIRNVLTIKTGTENIADILGNPRLSGGNRELVYFAGFKFKAPGIERGSVKEMYLSWDGYNPTFHNAPSLNCVGEYKHLTLL